jgi:hypothetical protein
MNFLKNAENLPGISKPRELQWWLVCDFVQKLLCLMCLVYYQDDYSWFYEYYLPLN